MASLLANFTFTLLLLMELFTINLPITDAQIGVCYGMLGNNLPPPNEVVELYRSNNIKRMRIYDPNPNVLQALRNSGIELMLGVPNTDLRDLATNEGIARQWVQRNVLNYWPSVRIKYVAVGTEVRPGGDLAQYVLHAIQNIYQALRAQGLHDQIKVSTAISTELLNNGFPPSRVAFKGEVRSYIDPIIGYLVYANAPLLVNIYPYFSYAENSNTIPLSYALFTSPNVVVRDGQYEYQNLFDAILDSMHAAIDNTGIRYAAMDDTGTGHVETVVTESGWPSDGGFGANYNNARTFSENLVRRSGRGTPRRPSKPTEIYMFDMFDENNKSPPIEQHFGLFYPNKQKKYPINFGGN